MKDRWTIFTGDKGEHNSCMIQRIKFGWKVNLIEIMGL